MNIFPEIIEKRILNLENVHEIKDKKNELREISQEIILSGLAKYGFFENAVFFGGTALRLVHNLNRYSEDLDFRFINNNDNFDWIIYYDKLKNYAKTYGFDIKYISDNSGKLKRAYFIDDKIIEKIHKKKILDMSWAKNSAGAFSSIEVQLDISYRSAKYNRENKELLFPEKHNIKVFDIHSLFGGKIKAILTRRDKHGNEINEGRDWFDLDWFVKKRIEPNFDYLFESLVEDKKYEKYKDKDKLNESFIKNELFNRARNLNFNEMNVSIENMTTKNNRLVLSHKVTTDMINNLGKNGYSVKNKLEKVEDNG